jgi:hypothetical protein
MESESRANDIFDVRVGGRTPQSAEMAENFDRVKHWRFGPESPAPKSNHRGGMPPEIEWKVIATPIYHKR